MARLPDNVKHGGDLILPWVSWYMMLLVPCILFCGSLYIPPTAISDSADGFFALRRMLYQNSQTLTHPAGVLPGHPLQKRTEAQ